MHPHIGRKLLPFQRLLFSPRYTALFYYYRRRKAPFILATKPVRTPARGNWAVRYLTCKDLVLETLWAAKSLFRFVEAPLYFHEDGSFDRKCFQLIKEHFPDARIITRKESDERTIPLLSEKCLNVRQAQFMFLRVFDFQVWAEEPYLQVDADVLFFKPPDAIKGQRALYNCGPRDQLEHTGWDHSVILQQTGLDLRGFNAGLLFLPYRLSFERIEHWLDVLGTPSYPWATEQTILNLETETMGADPLSPDYDIYERHWPDVTSEHYLERSRLNMYRKGYPVLQPRLVNGCQE
ncbi:MAG: hypothetical protein ND895_28235 [Pyrinomonadaceae bacterium]|nr:hypothetical protein [Pyrinomonadaceae bacterium]